MNKVMLRTLLILPLGLVACANPNLNDLQQFVAREKAKPPGQIQPIPEIKPIETYTYSVQERRDPFILDIAQATEEKIDVYSGITPDFRRRKEELESYALDALRMVGTLEQDNGMWGLVKTKEGTIHRVKSGNYMGLNHGRIVMISEDKIELSEIVQDGSGGYIERQASIALAE